MSCKNQSMFMCPTIRQSFCWSLFRLVKEVQHSRESYLIACRFEIKNIYIEKHGTNIQSDSCKLFLRSKREMHVYRINNSPDKKRQKEQNDYQK